ncbi:MAG: hypothetical protein GY786_06160 [Proteobacteria bacterium]|nr:hypothetical protein [Pseudomonadota bacterium]
MHLNISHYQKVLIFWILIFLNGCGFQLNRNQIKLPDNAESLQISRVQNKSFRPGLDLKLEQYLSSQLATKGIMQTASSLADLTLDFTVINTSSSKVEHSLQSGSQTYLFSFRISGTLNLKDNRENSFIHKNLKFQSSYSVETSSTDLTEVEIDSGYQKSLEDLGSKVIKQLTQIFLRG